ncbi:MAG: sulfatase-like hydrolase/transferase [Verrucomicrobiota bacterium]
MNGLSHSLFRFALVGLSLGFFSSLSSRAADRPNVILIYSDDQGSIDLGCYGSKDLQTPHLDRLAEKGLRFTRMYSPSAICSASRAGLLTGRMPVRAGVPGNVPSLKGKKGMPTSEVTIAEMMREAGYATGHVGKWHLGYTPETMPNGQGFQTSYGHMGGCIDNYSHFFYWNGPNRHDLWRNGTEIWEDGEFFGDLMVREANAFIEANKAKTFFLYWAINFPHYPLQGTAKWREVYKNLEEPRGMYNAFVSTMDEMIGEIIAKVDALGIRENTLIIFQSDHGHSTEERTFWSGGNPGPYRGAKGCLFEGGLRVPSIVSHPGKLPENEVRDQLAVGVDWFPTLAEWCDLSLPGKKLDGKSLVPILKSASATTPHKEVYWQLGGGKQPQWVVQKEGWKLLGNPRDTNRRPSDLKEERILVNLTNDIGETKNLAEQHPEKVTELEKVRTAFLDSLK